MHASHTIHSSSKLVQYLLQWNSLKRDIVWLKFLFIGSLTSLDVGDETTLSSTWPADSEIFAQLRSPIHPHRPAQL